VVYYSNSLVRRIQFVLDTGIHVYGWSRQKAIYYLFVNSALSMQNCILQIDQYITKPGKFKTCGNRVNNVLWPKTSQG